MSEPLKLRAIDADDVAVLAACLQDALVPASDMRYLPAERRFVLVANRFCWEKLPATALDPAAARVVRSTPSRDAAHRKESGSAAALRAAHHKESGSAAALSAAHHKESGSAAGEEPMGPYERVHCGLSIEHVKKVQTRGFSATAAEDAERLFEVLTILSEDIPGDGAALTLVFSGQAAVRVEVERVEILARDVDEPWPTLWRPNHPGMGGDS